MPELADQPEHRDHGYDLRDVEIFRVGTWNGDKYTEGDLDDMVSAFDGVGYRPPVKLGHTEESGDPAYGWVAAIRRVGDKILADFSDLPQQIYQAIKDRRYDSVSSEIYFNIKRGEQKFRRALKAVALLGAEIPGVAGLAPLRDSFVGLSTDNVKVRTYSLDLEELTEGDEMPKDTAKDLQDQITAAEDELAKLTGKADAGGEDEAAGVDDAAEQPEPKKLKAAPGQKTGALEIRRLQEQLAETKQALAGAQEREKATRLAAKAERDRIPDLQEQIATLKERARQDRVASKVDGVKIPALRAHFAVLYDLASADSEKVVSFKFDDSRQSQADVSPEEVVDDLVGRINLQAERLFQELATAGKRDPNDEPEHENPGDELDRLTKQYMSRHKITDYRDAFRAVQADPANADLVRDYASVSRGN